MQLATLNLVSKRKLSACLVCATILTVSGISVKQPAFSNPLKTIELALAGGGLPAHLKNIRVKLGDRVTLLWRSDSPVEIHLHGYDKLLRVTPGSPAPMTFDCHATGRFPITLHGGAAGKHSHKPIAYFEVHPK